MSTPKLFSDRVSKLQSDLGLTQAELAKRLGISRNYVSMIIGGREPGDSLKKLVEVLEQELKVDQSMTCEETGPGYFARPCEALPIEKSAALLDELKSLLVLAEKTGRASYIRSAQEVVSELTKLLNPTE